VEDDDVLEYALTKLNTTRNELIEELKRERPEYANPQNVYACQNSDDHVCAVGCTTLEEDFSDEELNEYSTHHVRGLCCRSKSPDNREGWCASCAKNRKKRAK